VIGEQTERALWSAPVLRRRSGSPVAVHEQLSASPSFFVIVGEPRVSIA